MSQSLGNFIGITDPPDDMFGKLVRVPDELIPTYRLLALDFFRDPTEAELVEKGLADGSLDPWQEKRRLAREVVDLYHGDGAGEAAMVRFDRVHRDHEVPDDVPEREIPPEAVRDGAVYLPKLMVALGLADSNSRARKLIERAPGRASRIRASPVKDQGGRHDARPLDLLDGAFLLRLVRQVRPEGGLADQGPLPFRVAAREGVRRKSEVPTVRGRGPVDDHRGVGDDRVALPPQPRQEQVVRAAQYLPSIVASAGTDEKYVTFAGR
jgi:hypothetical protein